MKRIKNPWITEDMERIQAEMTIENMDKKLERINLALKNNETPIEVITEEEYSKVRKARQFLLEYSEKKKCNEFAKFKEDLKELDDVLVGYTNNFIRLGDYYFNVDSIRFISTTNCEITITFTDGLSLSINNKEK